VWVVNGTELRETMVFGAENVTEIELEAEGAPKLKSNDVTGEVAIGNEVMGMQHTQLTLHSVEVEGHPECKVKSEGAAANTIVMEMDGEAVALANSKEEKTEETATNWFGINAPIKLEKEEYDEPLTKVLEITGTCPASLPAGSAVLNGDLLADWGSWNPTTSVFTEGTQGTGLTGPAIDFTNKKLGFSWQSTHWGKFSVSGDLGFDNKHEPLDILGTIKWDASFTWTIKW
jgi:hypothetical protein